MQGDAASFGHFGDAGKRLEGANQNAARFAFWFAGDIEAIVIAVDEIDIGVAGRSEEDGGTGGVAGRGMGGRIIPAEVGFDFYDAGRKGASWCGANQQLAQKAASDAAGRSGEEGTIEKMWFRDRWHQGSLVDRAVRWVGSLRLWFCFAVAKQDIRSG